MHFYAEQTGSSLLEPLKVLRSLTTVVSDCSIWGVTCPPQSHLRLEEEGEDPFFLVS
jgi:hypothetical protein